MQKTTHPSLVELEIQDCIATLTLCAPATRNALDEPLARELGAAVAQAAAHPGLRVLRIRARGAQFCVGADLAQLRGPASERAARVDAIMGHLNPALVQLREMPALVVTSVQGAAAGGGLCLVAAADYVIAQPGARFTVAYGAIAATPDLGASWFLPRILGERHALRLALFNEGFDAARAQEFGLVQDVVSQDELEARSLEIAHRLAGGPSLAFAKAKSLFHTSAGRSLAEHLQHERAALLEAVQHPDFEEGVGAFLERRPPRYQRGA